MLKKCLASGIAICALAIASTASALPITISEDDPVGTSFIINFDGNIETDPVGGLTATATFAFQGIEDHSVNSGTFEAYKFEVVFENTTDDSIWASSRASAFGWNVDPDVDEGDVTGAFSIAGSGTFPNEFGDVEVCVKAGGGPNNCQGGGGGGLLIGQSGTAIVWLGYDPDAPVSIDLSNFGVRWQDLTSEDGPFNGDSGTGRGTPGDSVDPNLVPEPATLALLGSGLIAGGLIARRRRSA